MRRANDNNNVIFVKYLQSATDIKDHVLSYPVLFKLLNMFLWINHKLTIDDSHISLVAHIVFLCTYIDENIWKYMNHIEFILSINIGVIDNTY